MTKRDLILHIGYPKTGTTSIQQAMTRQRQAILAAGVCYPASPGGTMHQMVAIAALADGEEDRPRKRRKLGGMPHHLRVDQFLRNFNEELEGLPASVTRVVLSAKPFSLILRDEQQIEKFRAFLARYFGSIRVVVYLRRQDRLGTIFYSQLLRRGIMEEPRLTTERPDHAHLYDYDAFLQRWANVFGRDAVTPRIFEPARLLNGDVVQDFYHLCGLDPKTAPNRQANPSIALEGQALLLTFGRMLKEAESNEATRDRHWLRFVNSVTELFPGTGWRPTKAEAEAFMVQFGPGNEAVRRDYFPQSATLFDEDFSKLPVEAVTFDSIPLLPAAFKVLMESVRRSVKQELNADVAKAQLKMRSGDNDKARKWLKRAMTKGSKNAEVRLEIARFFAAEGDLPLALGHAEAALEINPVHEGARAYVAELTELHKKGGAAAAA